MKETSLIDGNLWSEVRKKKTNGEVGGEPPMVALTILLSRSDLKIVFKQG